MKRKTENRIKDCVARMRILADMLPCELREEANSIASDLAGELKTKQVDFRRSEEIAAELGAGMEG
ncbi:MULTISPECIES: hypothetical protein [unclassified Maridesulfovibrio]|uniref:hypothetical protein n=1 Tax=unclassified Maridesulfovibrio TaxID=2794999 RepID=UPI003B3C4CCE